MLFAVEVFGVTLDPWQERVLRAFGRGERGISIRACHGPGKTMIAAILVWLMLLTRFPQKTVATAPSRGQLEDALVSEILKWGAKLPPALRDLFEVKKNRIELKAAPADSFFTARTARAENPEALQGVHSDNVLLIADEASGVPEAIFEAAAGSMSGHSATTLLLGNPVRSSGTFYDSHNKNRAHWYTERVSYTDSSRVSQEFADDIARRYGENSNAYRIRVLGEFPLGDLDTVIPFELVESARKRDLVLPPNLRTVWGVDVARFGDDYCALVERSRLHVAPRILEWQGRDTMQSAGKIKALWDDTPPSERPDEILIDVIGIGAGVVDRLRELNLPARGINVSETDSVDPKYRNLRTELWFKAKDWLGGRDRSLPTCPLGCARDCLHEKFAQELVSPRFDYMSNGKLMVEPKAAMKKRKVPSPNIADAFCLTFASEITTLLNGPDGRRWGSNWNEPIRMKRATV